MSTDKKDVWIRDCRIIHPFYDTKNNKRVSVLLSLIVDTGTDHGY
ncbi:MAG: hypothetical protein Q4C61_15080 [Lachnospiraceae bacterium]|nr:hypothetical protein [Lachnospiraceae bacterium]